MIKLKEVIEKNIDYKIKKREDGGSCGYNFEVITLIPETAKNYIYQLNQKPKIIIHYKVYNYLENILLILIFTKNLIYKYKISKFIIYIL